MLFGQSELSSSVPRRDGDAVRFFDDMDVSDRHLHSLHQSISDLNNGQQRLRQELEEERLRRSRCVRLRSAGTDSLENKNKIGFWANFVNFLYHN